MHSGYRLTRKIPSHEISRKKSGAFTKKSEEAKSRKSPLIDFEFLGTYTTADGHALSYVPSKGFFQKGRQIAIKPGKLLPIMSPFFVTAEKNLSRAKVNQLLEINFEAEKRVEDAYSGKMYFQMTVKKIGDGRYEVIQCKDNHAKRIKP